MYYMELKYNNGDVITANDFMSKIEVACYEHGIDDGLQGLAKAPTAQFNNILYDVGQMFTRPAKVVQDVSLDGTVYSLTKLNVLLDFYLYLCNEYNKCMTLDGFYKLCGIGCKGANYGIDENGEIIKAFERLAVSKIDQADNARMMGKAQDSNQAVLNIAYSNYRHNWGGQIRSKEAVTMVKSLDDVRRERVGMSANGEQNRRFALGNNDEKP